MFDSEPNMAEVRHVLTLASNAKVESSDYFLAMLDASAEGGENVENAISTFTRLFRTRKLHDCMWLVGELLIGFTLVPFAGTD